MTFQARIDTWLDVKTHSYNYNELFPNSNQGNYKSAYAVKPSDLAHLAQHSDQVTELTFHLGAENNTLTPFLQYGPDLEAHSILLELAPNETLPQASPNSALTQNSMEVSITAADNMIKDLYGKDMHQAVCTKSSRDIVKNYRFKNDVANIAGKLPQTTHLHFWFGIYSKEELELGAKENLEVSNFPVLNVILSKSESVYSDNLPFDFSVPCPPVCPPDIFL
ncbi:MAG: hypothetical protein AAFQ98_00150 [Bacteroidota bacterium]